MNSFHRAGSSAPDGLAFYALLALSSSLGCDVGRRAADGAHGPALKLLSSTPSNGEGVACNPSDPLCGTPQNGPILVRFDRPLDPNSATRQAISVYTGSPNVGSPFLSPTYDVLERALSFRLGAPLLPQVLYQVELTLPDEPGAFGIRAYDGAPLVEGDVPSHFSFMTSASAGAADAPQTFSEPTCGDIVTLFQASCSGSCCHGGARPAMGLALASSEGLLTTAIGQVAHQTDRGDTLGVTYQNPPRFGLAMPIIEPRRPANSYLIYKLLIHEENLVPCSQLCGPFETLPGARSCQPLSAEERDRIRDWFVPGEAMPVLAVAGEAGCSGGSRHAPLDCASMRAIARWIGNGARCP